MTPLYRFKKLLTLTWEHAVDHDEQRVLDWLATGVERVDALTLAINNINDRRDLSDIGKVSARQKALAQAHDDLKPWRAAVDRIEREVEQQRRDLLGPPPPRPAGPVEYAEQEAVRQYLRGLPSSSRAEVFYQAHARRDLAVLAAVEHDPLKTVAPVIDARTIAKADEARIGDALDADVSRVERMALAGQHHDEFFGVAPAAPAAPDRPRVDPKADAAALAGAIAMLASLSDLTAEPDYVDDRLPELDDSDDTW